MKINFDQLVEQKKRGLFGVHAGRPKAGPPFANVPLGVFRIMTLHQFLLLVGIGFGLVFTVQNGLANDSTNPAEDDPEISYDKHSKLREISTDLAKIFFWDLDFEKKIINLSHSRDQWVLDDYSQGVRVVQTLRLAGWLPPTFNYSIPARLPIWINPTVGATLISDRFAKSAEIAKKLQRPQVPTKVKHLETWSVGDHVTYQVDGGVGFTAGWDVGGAYAGGYYFAQGEWIVHVKKTSPTSIYLKYTRANLNVLGFSIGTSFVTMGTSAFGNRDHEFSFAYNLNHSQAALAFEDAIQGNLIPSMEFVRKGDSQFVQKVSVSTSATAGIASHWYFGLPFIGSMGGQQGKLQTLSETRTHRDESESKIQYGVYFSEDWSHGLLSQHQKRLNHFYAVHVKNTDKSGEHQVGYWGQFLWGRESEETNQKWLKKIFSRLKRLTGIDDVTFLRSLEGDQFSEEELQYAKVAFTATLGELATRYLMDQSASLSIGFTKNITMTLEKLVQDYFSKGTDSDRICKFEDRKWESIPECIRRYLSEGVDSVQSMVYHLSEMHRTQIDHPLQFTQHFAEFGKHMTSNRFTFGSIVAVTQKYPVEMILWIEGERLSKIKKKIDLKINSLLF